MNILGILLLTFAGIVTVLAAKLSRYDRRIF